MQFGGEAWNRFIADKHKEGIPDKSENEIAGYLDFRQAIGSYLTMDAGLRIDHHTVTGTEWIPQVGLSVQLPQDASLKAMASKGFRNPTIRELYMFRPANPDLLPERLWNYELSYPGRVILSGGRHFRRMDPCQRFFQCRTGFPYRSAGNGSANIRRLSVYKSFDL